MSSRPQKNKNTGELLRQLAKESERIEESSATSGTEEGAAEETGQKKSASWRAAPNDDQWESDRQKIVVFNVSGTLSQMAHHSAIRRHPTTGELVFAKGAAASGGHASQSCSFKQLFDKEQNDRLEDMDFRITGMGISENQNSFPFPVALFISEVRATPKAQITHTTWGNTIKSVEKSFQNAFSMDVSLGIENAAFEASQSEEDSYEYNPFTLSLNIDGVGADGSVEKKMKLAPDSHGEKSKEENCACPAPEPKWVFLTCLGVWEAFSSPKLPSAVFNSITDGDYDHASRSGRSRSRSRSAAGEMENEEEIANTINSIIARGQDFFVLTDGIIGEDNDHVIVPYGSPIWELFNKKGADGFTTAEIYKRTALLDPAFAEGFEPKQWDEIARYLDMKHRNASRPATVLPLDKKRLITFLENTKSPHSRLSKSWLEHAKSGTLRKDEHWAEAEDGGMFRVVLMDRIEVYFVLGFFLKNKECILNSGDITAFLVRLDSPANWEAQGDLTASEYAAARDGRFQFNVALHFQAKTRDLALELSS